jgi:hypothetical protein
MMAAMRKVCHNGKVGRRNMTALLIAPGLLAVVLYMPAVVAIDYHGQPRA